MNRGLTITRSDLGEDDLIDTAKSLYLNYKDISDVSVNKLF